MELSLLGFKLTIVQPVLQISRLDPNDHKHKILESIIFNQVSSYLKTFDICEHRILSFKGT